MQAYRSLKAGEQLEGTNRSHDAKSIAAAAKKVAKDVPVLIELAR